MPKYTIAHLMMTTSAVAVVVVLVTSKNGDFFVGLLWGPHTLLNILGVLETCPSGDFGSGPGSIPGYLGIELGLAIMVVIPIAIVFWIAENRPLR